MLNGAHPNKTGRRRRRRRPSWIRNGLQFEEHLNASSGYEVVSWLQQQSELAAGIRSNSLPSSYWITSDFERVTRKNAETYFKPDPPETEQEQQKTAATNPRKTRGHHCFISSESMYGYRIDSMYR